MDDGRWTAGEGSGFSVQGSGVGYRASGVGPDSSVLRQNVSYRWHPPSTVRRPPTVFRPSSIVHRPSSSGAGHDVLGVGQQGVLNDLLARVQVRGPNWLGDPAWSKIALVLMGIWGVGNAMVIYLAGLQDVPTQLYEAADLDGASWWSKMRHVTLPMLSP